ncbi:hypothetical protein COB11_02410 [Candidatus Aerophobetes bacterium]|uniref:prephenate dehydratase n=1 Tax=Aerophobetes bacterium TaxID=2030807 RepID=A0A2A4YKN5_UNCAE|nr:MAG: hypothetical protein COB11_02410 [Candidatus Aerophobetes bacterium]
MVLITLGPAGTFSEMAAKSYYSNEKIVLKDSIADVFLALMQDESAKALLPFLNSTSGIIAETILGLMKNKLYICSKHSLEISYTLAGAASISSCKKLYVHPHAYMQCKKSLEDFKGEIVYTMSNSHSARFAKNDPSSLSLTTKEAARENDLPILKEKIKDKTDNTTYFGKVCRKLPDSSGKTLLLEFECQSGLDALKSILKDFELYFLEDRKTAICEVPSETDVDMLFSKTCKDTQCYILGKY